MQLALGAKKGSNSQVAVCQAQLDACVVRVVDGLWICSSLIAVFKHLLWIATV